MSVSMKRVGGTKIRSVGNKTDVRFFWRSRKTCCSLYFGFTLIREQQLIKI